MLVIDILPFFIEGKLVKFIGKVWTFIMKKKNKFKNGVAMGRFLEVSCVGYER